MKFKNIACIAILTLISQNSTTCSQKKRTIRQHQKFITKRYVPGYDYPQDFVACICKQDSCKPRHINNDSNNQNDIEFAQYWNNRIDNNTVSFIIKKNPVNNRKSLSYFTEDEQATFSCKSFSETCLTPEDKATIRNYNIKEDAFEYLRKTKLSTMYSTDTAQNIGLEKLKAVTQAAANN